MEEIEAIAERLKDEFPVLPLSAVIDALVAQVREREMTLRIRLAF
jgi:hypothetical protein